MPELKTALARSDDSQLGMLRRLVEADDNFNDARFEFDFQLLILGIERFLDADHSNDGQPASP